MKQTMALAAVVLLSLGCQARTPTLTPDERAEVAQSLSQLVMQLAETWNAGDEEAYLDCYLADSTFTFAVNGTITRGWAAFADTVRMHRNELAQSTVTYDRIYVDVLSHDHGVVTATFDWSAVDTTGTQQQMRGTYTTLMSRTAIGWKVVNVAESFPPVGK